MIGSTYQSRWPVRVFAAAAFAFALPLGAQNNAATTSRLESAADPAHGDLRQTAGRRRANHHGAAHGHLVHDAEPRSQSGSCATPGTDRGDIDDYGKAHIYLGGVQIDTKANRARSLTTSTGRGSR